MSQLNTIKTKELMKINSEIIDEFTFPVSLMLTNCFKNISSIAEHHDQNKFNNLSKLT